MKYIDFESWTVTWPHEGNVIVEDQLTHNFKRRSRTAPPKAVFYAAVQNVSKAGNDSVLKCPWHWRAGLWKLDWLRLSIVSLLWFITSGARSAERALLWLRAEREARSEFFCSLREKSQYARPNPTQPDPTPSRFWAYISGTDWPIHERSSLFDVTIQ